MSVAALPRATPARHRAARRSTRARLRGLVRATWSGLATPAAGYRLVTGLMLGGLIVFGLAVAVGL